VKQTPKQKMGKEIVMVDNENFVAEATENAEVTAEETQAVEQPTEKTYTQSELDEIIGKRLARNSAKIRREYDKQYGELVDVLKAGTGKDDVKEMTDTFKDFYQKKGIKIVKKPNEYSARDIEVLAKAEADEFISGGYEDVVEEVDRLAEIGIENMTAREKATFTHLMEYANNTKNGRELAKIGVSEDVYNSKEFRDFSAKFNSNTPIADIYNIYKNQQPKKEIKTAGSMKYNTADSSGVKDFYSYEEASKFTKEDFDKDPALYEAVLNSMPKWK
jgi:hypothetical protein